MKNKFIYIFKWPEREYIFCKWSFLSDRFLSSKSCLEKQAFPCIIKQSMHAYLSTDVIAMLEHDGKVTVKEGSSELLKLPLRCHVCRKEQPTIPKLKEHLKTHLPH